MLQSKIKKFYYPRRFCVINALDRCSKINSKSVKYIIGKLKEAKRTPISYDSSVGGRDGCRRLPTSMAKRFLSLVSDFAFISREYVICFATPSDDCI